MPQKLWGKIIVFILVLLSSSFLVACSENSPTPTFSLDKNRLKLAFATPELPGHTDDIVAMAFSPDGKILATGSNDTSIRLWSVEKGTELKTLNGFSEPVYSFYFTSNGKYLITWEDDRVRIWSVSSGQLITSVEGDLKAISPQSTNLVTYKYNWGDTVTTYTLWSLEKGEKLDEVKTDTFYDIKYDHQNNVLLIERKNDSVEIISLKDKQPKTLSLASFKETNTLNPKDNLLVSFSYDEPKKVQVYSLNKQTVYKIEMAAERLYTEALSSKQNLLAVAAQYPQNSTLLLFKLSDKNFQYQIPIEKDEIPDSYLNAINQLTFSANEKYLAWINFKKELKVWSIEQNKEILSKKISAVDTPFAISLDEKILSVATEKGLFQIISLETGKELLTVKGKKHNVNAVAFSQDSQTLATGQGDGTIKLFSVPQGKETGKIEANQGEVKALTLAPNANLASGGEGNLIKFWSLADKKQVGEFQVSTSDVKKIVFSPNGEYLAVIGGGETINFHGKEVFRDKLEIWSLKSKQLVYELNELLDFNIYDVSFSPDSQNIAIGSGYEGDSALFFWNLDELIKSYQDENSDYRDNIIGSEDASIAVIFTPTNNLLLSSYGFGIKQASLKDFSHGVKIWSLDSKEEIRRIVTPKVLGWIALNLDGTKLFATSQDGTLRAWDFASGRELSITTAYSLNSVALAPNGKYIATGHYNGSVKLWIV
jgi:WD40 repeat protein